MLTLLQAGLALVGTACALRLIGYTRTTRWMQQSQRQFRPRQPPSPSPREIGEAINAVAIVTHLARGSITCLPRACALHWLLARRGCDARICFGVRPVDCGVEAHAWVELDGVPLGEHASLGPTFVPLRARVDLPSVTGERHASTSPLPAAWTHHPSGARRATGQAPAMGSASAPKEARPR